MYRLVLTIALVFSAASAAFGQSFNVVSSQSALYPRPSVGVVIPESQEQAILRVVYIPQSPSISQATVLDSSIQGSLVVSSESQYTQGAYGWYETDTYEGQDVTVYYSIVDASSIYVRGNTSVSSAYLNQIQTILDNKGLGTVSDRALFIKTLHGIITLPQLVDVRGVFNDVLKIIQPFALLFVALYGSVFILGSAFKYFEKVANMRRKLQVKLDKEAERIAQARDTEYKFLTLVVKGSAARYAETHSKIDRKAYREAFREYTKYRESKGWRY